MPASKKKATNGHKDTRLSADSQLEHLRDRLNKKRDYIAILELELFNTRSELAEISGPYNERIAPLEARLRELRRLLYDRLEEEKSVNGNGAHEQPEPEEEEDPDAAFQYQDRINGYVPPRDSAQSAKKKLNPRLEEKIRKLFRELAKRFHPDLTADPEEKTWREEVMALVNQAYADRDLKTLEELAEQPDRAGKKKRRTREQEITELKAELERLDQVISELKATIKILEDSPPMRLKMQARMQRRDGNDLLSEMEAEIEEQIDGLEEHLITLGVSLEEIAAAGAAAA